MTVDLKSLELCGMSLVVCIIVSMNKFCQSYHYKTEFLDTDFDQSNLVKRANDCWEQSLNVNLKKGFSSNIMSWTKNT